MKVAFLTIVLDGMPFIAEHYGQFKRLPFDWTWHVVEGVAAPEKCTSWCNRLTPRLSKDGTTQYLASLQSFDQRVRLYRSEWWHGKVEMCNAPLRTLQEACLLVQIDSDELWTTEQLAGVRALFMRDPRCNCAMFRCRYFVGRDLVIEPTHDGFGNHEAFEWKRAWKFQPGMRFKSHEPPVIENMGEKPFSHAQTADLGLVFDHFAYATRAQVRFKEFYYAGAENPNAPKYLGLEAKWEQLQQNREWPTRLDRFMPFVDERSMVNKL